MIDLKGYEDAQAVLPGEFAKLPAGGYVCGVVHAEITKSKAGNPMLVLYLDIVEGEFAKYFRDAFDRVRNSRPDIKWDNSGVYRQLIFAYVVIYKSSVFSGDAVLFELCRKRLMGLIVLCYHKKPAGVLIDPVDYAGPYHTID